MSGKVSQEEDLEQRLREVLREVVARFIATGEPVSSRSLARGSQFGLSPATLRNVMADLEDLGYLTHPHTSAGRVPTDLGYRYFINHLMKSRRLSSHDRGMIDGEVSRANELDELLQVASRLLNKLSGQVGVVFLPNIPQIAVRSLDFIPVAERKILCIIVATNGMVMNKLVEVPVNFAREELERIGHYLSEEFSGLTLVEMRDRLLAMMKEERARFDQLLQNVISLGVMASDVAVPGDHDLYLEGAASILDQPEFTGVEAMRRTLQAFEEKGKLVAILTRCIQETGLQILIGSESQFTQSYNFSLIASRYGSEASPVGLVGIIGPTRMEYARIAPLVEYLGDALSRKIDRRAGEPE